MAVIDVLLIVLILSASVLCIYLIITLNKLNKSIEVLQKDIHVIAEKTVPTLESINEVAQKAVVVTTEVEEQLAEVKSFIQSVKGKVSKVTEFPKNINPENRINELLKNLNAISKGFSAFWTKFFS